MSDIGSRRALYIESAKKLAGFLEGKISEEVGFPDYGVSWGYAFCAVFANALDRERYCRLLQCSVAAFNRQDKSDKNYSWEFVVFAAGISKNDGGVKGLHVPFRNKGTRVFNWYLLRALNKILCGKFRFWDEIELRLALAFFQDSSGLIKDEFRTRSYQYHAFSLFVLCNIFEHLKENDWIKSRIYHGVDFLLRNMMRDGTSLYLGRGQEQIFGYGALLYVLEYCDSRFFRIDHDILNVIASKILSYQRDDGSYPLVLRRRQPESADVTFYKDSPAGWYGYNSLYDYLPFLGYCLVAASRL